MKKNYQYELFVDKFKPRLTTDDCYTPQRVYNAILSYVKEKFNILESQNVIRPFYPGGDFESIDYAPNDIIIDNPPFSIMKKIVRFYSERGIKFFLFAPSLTLFEYIDYATCVICNAGITYENGAIVNMSFVTNLYEENYAFTIEHQLIDIIKESNKSVKKDRSKVKAIINHPKNVTSAALLSKLANCAKDDIRVPRSSIYHIKRTDNYGALFGSGVLLSDKVAEKFKQLLEKEREKEIITYYLSDKEKKIIEGLD